MKVGPTTSTSTATATRSTPLPDKKLLLLILDKLQKWVIVVFNFCFSWVLCFCDE